MLLNPGAMVFGTRHSVNITTISLFHGSSCLIQKEFWVPNKKKS